MAEQWVTTLADLDPTVATWIGIPGRHDEYADQSPEGHARMMDAARATIAQLDAAASIADAGGAAPLDDVDRITVADLRADLQLSVESSEAGLYTRDLNVIASPAQNLRDILDLMPTATADDWSDIAGRLRSMPTAIDGYIETLRLGIRGGTTPARRQVDEVRAQAEKLAAADGFFPGFVADPTLDDGTGVPRSLAADLEAGAAASTAAYGTLAVFLADELMPAATDHDAVGRDAYALHSRGFLGATIDLDETYEWGIEELRRMTDEQEAIARAISGGGSVADAIRILDTDPARMLHGTDELQRWMQQLSDTAVRELAGTHFDIPEPLTHLECLIAPTQEGGIYYTSPSDDFSRPGRMWWSVPPGVTEFGTWREATTVYHEGIPGHHLQLGQAVYNRAKLNTWRRQLAGTSGHAEGWALYAERLMQELGYLDDPGDRLGMLDGQRMRAARVVLDIGVHLGKPRLDGTGSWDFDYAFEFMKANVNMNEPSLRFEVNRYFGWPGQAPSYKVGQRIWEQLRDDVRASQGAAFDPREFHRRALDIGGVGLDTLRAALRA
ncbi:DUF885 domain-containing protein [Marisediminicola senii]|uniref:DUF885 domain-containing protein n=1 Tax=Marisediminicola senii TaxID=2711233 RepID=UPI0013EB1A5D|nr:DUF885 domain-containing protein [Marisediminicola senii]